MAMACVATTALSVPWLVQTSCLNVTIDHAMMLGAACRTSTVVLKYSKLFVHRLFYVSLYQLFFYHNIL